MDTTKNNNETPENKKPAGIYSDNKSKSTNTVALMVLLGLLLIAVGVIGYLYYQRTQDLEKQNEVNILLEDQKSDLQNQLQTMIIQYDSLRTDSDSINILLEAEQAKIKKLLGINASNAYKIRLYKKEMQTLRDIMKSYVVQIDSLNQLNEKLTAENVEVRTKLQQEKSKTQQLLNEKQELSSTVEKASILTAKGILAEPLNQRSKPKFKKDKVAKIRTCFTVRENAVVAAGPVDIYIRITRPDDVVISKDGNTFESNGEQLVYSELRTLEYENVDIDMCIYWDNTEDNLIDGDYMVELYAQGNMIGSSGFTLK